MCLYRLFASDSLMPIGQTFVMTMLYSICWINSFSDSLVFLRRSLDIVNRNQIIASEIKTTLYLISRGSWVMFVVALVSFGIGPITFAVPLDVKWQMAFYVFTAEAMLFFSFNIAVSYLLFYKLCPVIQMSIQFLQSQIVDYNGPGTVSNNASMRINIEQLSSIHDVVKSSGKKNVARYSLLLICRVVLLILPHWFVFFVWIEMVYVCLHAVNLL